MPYPTLDSLPDGVKAIPKEAQEIWRNAFNSAVDQYPGDEERQNKIAWGAVKNAGWSKDAEGNWKKEKMAMSRDQDYSIWTSMKSRCLNNNDKDYERYGGRGISVCKRWRDSFENFMQDMGARKTGLTIERKNNDGNYEPSNCYWASRKDQGNNRNFIDDELKVFDIDIEIFSVGNWNGDEYTEEDLDDIVTNFGELKERVKPPVKLGHKGKWKDGLPALGWVTGLKREGEKLIAKLGQVPDIVYRAIKNGLYKRVSSEIFWNYSCDGKTFKRVLGGIALLGADFPAVDNLEDLEAYLSKYDGDFERYIVYSAEVVNGEIVKNIEYEEDLMNEQEKKEYEAKIKKETEDKKKAEDALKEFKRKDAEREKKDEEAKAKTESESFTSYCEELVKAGKLTPAARDYILKDESHLYTKENGVSIPLEVFKKLNFAKILLEGEKAEEGGKEEFANAQEEIDAKVRKYMSDHDDVEYSEAMTFVMKENPDLAKSYVDDVKVDKEGD